MRNRTTADLIVSSLEATRIIGVLLDDPLAEREAIHIKTAFEHFDKAAWDVVKRIEEAKS